jgi:hypothetical protein
MELNEYMADNDVSPIPLTVRFFTTVVVVVVVPPPDDDPPSSDPELLLELELPLDSLPLPDSVPEFEPPPPSSITTVTFDGPEIET